MLSPEEEKSLVGSFADLPFKPFEFHDFLGKRRVMSFEWRYDHGGQRVQPNMPVPDFLLPLRKRAAAVASLAAERLQQALVREYAPGAAIGWHRDKPMFDTVIASPSSRPAACDCAAVAVKHGRAGSPGCNPGRPISFAVPRDRNATCRRATLPRASAAAPAAAR